jgi:hypothetical protein
MDRMTRRGILKTIVGLAAGLFVRRNIGVAVPPVPLRRTALITLDIEWKKSIVGLRYPGRACTIALPIGERHFVNDVAWILRSSKEDAQRQIKSNGWIKPDGYFLNPPPGKPGYNTSLPPVAMALTARAGEFAEYLRDALKGVEDSVPVRVAGMELPGFPELLERVLDREVC